MAKTYTFYEDPGHGWLEVPMAELVELGIADKITRYSYLNGEYAYLEEDLDMATFLEAKVGPAVDGDYSHRRKWASENMETNDRATLRGAGEIFVRRLPSYSAVPFRNGPYH